MSVHKTALVFPGVDVPAGIDIGAYAFVGPGVVFQGTSQQIGEYADVAEGCILGSDIYIGSYAILGPGVIVGNNFQIGRNVWVGSHAQLGCGGKVGDGAEVPAGYILGNFDSVLKGMVHGNGPSTRPSRRPRENYGYPWPAYPAGQQGCTAPQLQPPLGAPGYGQQPQLVPPGYAPQLPPPPGAPGYGQLMPPVQPTKEASLGVARLQMLTGDPLLGVQILVQAGYSLLEIVKILKGEGLDDLAQQIAQEALRRMLPPHQLP